MTGRRRVSAHIPLPGQLHLAADHPVAAQTTRPDHLEAALSEVPDRQARKPPGRRECDAVLAGEVEVTRYRWRGTTIPTPWTGVDTAETAEPMGTRGAPDAWRQARPVRRAGRGNGSGEIPKPRPGPTLHRHRGAQPGCQARRRPAAPALGGQDGQHRVDVGRTAGYRAVRVATRGVRPRPRQRSWPARYHPPTPRTDPHPGRTGSTTPEASRCAYYPARNC